MRDIKIDDNGLFEEERRLNAYLNSNELEQLENQYAEIDKRWKISRNKYLQSLNFMGTFPFVKEKSFSFIAIRLFDPRKVGGGGNFTGFVKSGGGSSKAKKSSASSLHQGLFKRLLGALVTSRARVKTCHQPMGTSKPCDKSQRQLQ
ncbi:hypothetical protein TNCV_1752231 [Trichonephila clavipes]|nr:hypothetical protein TNCV_1752231 [Trichonephila clavipes]